MFEIIGITLLLASTGAAIHYRTLYHREQSRRTRYYQEWRRVVRLLQLVDALPNKLVAGVVKDMAGAESQRLTLDMDRRLRGWW